MGSAFLHGLALGFLMGWAACRFYSIGDRIRYGGGTDDKKPKYMGKES